MNKSSENKAKDNLGNVVLVGAGPGDMDLITMAGLKAIQNAQVLLYDALIDPLLLAQASKAEKIYVGKRARKHTKTQDETNELMAELALAGKHVVRLKGGDPFVFGRGAEEINYLAERGIPCRAIPGVTASTAAALSAGIPLSHRKFSSCISLITGHEDPSKPDSHLDYHALAAIVTAGGSLCFYMGLSRLKEIARTLVEAGLTEKMPAAVIQWGATPKQKKVTATLATIHERVQKSGLRAPSIIVVGQVVDMPEPLNHGLDFYESRPLFGISVINTRPAHQASSLTYQLKALGARVIESPAIEIASYREHLDTDEASLILQAIRDIAKYDWLVLTSANGVMELAGWLDQLNDMGEKIDARHFAGIKLAVIGDATAKACQTHLRLVPDLIPEAFVAESLAQAMLEAGPIEGTRILMLRADIARKDLKSDLQAGGAHIDDVPLYMTKELGRLSEEAEHAILKHRVSHITLTSSSTARAVVAMFGTTFGENARKYLSGIKTVAIGPITARTLASLDVNVDLEAEIFDTQGIINIIERDHAKS